MAWSQAPSPCRRRKRGRQNHPATASRRGSGRTPPGLETERRTPPATLADRFSICSHKNIMATFGQLSTDPKQAQLLPLGAPEPTGGAFRADIDISGSMFNRQYLVELAQIPP